MNDEINLPDCPENNPLSLSNVQTHLVCDLHVKGNEIYLPQSSPVDINSDEYDEEFLQSLPNDIASEVRSVLKNKRNHFTFLGLVIIFLFFSSVAWSFY